MSNIWKDRAEVLLPVAEEAAKLVQSGLYEVGAKGGRTTVLTKDFDRLKEAVDAFLKMAKEESDRP